MRDFKFQIRRNMLLLPLPPIAGLCIYFSAFDPISLATSIIFISIFIFFTLIRKISGKKISKSIASTLFVSMFTFSVMFADAKYDLIPRVKVFLKLGDISNCSVQPRGNPGGIGISVCEVDNRWWRFRFTRAVIFDSSDEIRKAGSSRSDEWRQRALALQGEVPFGIIGFDAADLGNHIYMVRFYDDVKSDF